MTIDHNSPTSTIKSWQTFLADESFSVVGTPDGIWGAHTDEATKEFQQANGLTPDGIAGPNTIAAAEAKGFVIPETKPFQPAGHLNTVFDISHLNDSPKPDFATAKANGMMAVFHKATQYTDFTDDTYASRRIEATNAGLLWGAYHFGAGGDGVAQANFFLEKAQPDGQTLLVLDFERSTTGSETTMSVAEARDFVNQIYAKTGKYPGIYGGSTLKDDLQAAADPTLSKCWLWIAQYGETVHLPNGWDTYTFWQYTDGTRGPGPVPVDGIGHCDRDLFQGNEETLNAFWQLHGV